MLIFLLSPACFGEMQEADDSNAVLSVNVINGTANGSGVVGDVVTVEIYQHNQLLVTLEDKTAENGKAMFNNVPTGEHTVAVAGVKHQNMKFKGRPFTISSKQVDADVKVFDVSYDKSKLSVKIHHFIIKANADTLLITEYIQLNNSSDTAISSEQSDSQGRAVVLEMSLPMGYRNFKTTSFFEQDALVMTPDGFYDTYAVAPGQYYLNFTYTLDIHSGELGIVKKITVPTSSFVLFAELGQAKIEGLAQAETASAASGMPIEYYKLSGLARQQEVALRITGFNVETSSFFSWMLLSVVFGAVFILILFRLRK